MRARNSVLLLAIAACSGRPTPAPQPTGGAAGAPPAPPPAHPIVVTAPPPPPPTTAPVADDPASHLVSLADVGLEADSLDRSADPCVDFYQFACGGWLAHNSIPPDRSRWMRFSQLAQHVDDTLQAMLVKDAAAPADATQTKLGTFYSACTNTAALETAGLAPLKPMLALIAKIGAPKQKDWIAVVAAFHKLGIPAVWNVAAEADFHDSKHMVTTLDSGRLSLPNREYYLASEFASQLTAYEAHLVRVFGILDQLGGTTTDGAVAAKDVIAIETALAEPMKSSEQARDVDKMNNPTDSKALQKQTKLVDWKTYWKALGVTPSKRIIVGTPAYFAALDGIRTKFTAPQWQHYFTYVLVANMHVALPAALDDEMFALRSTLTGVKQQLPRAQRCTLLVEEELGQLVGQQYIAEQFPAQTRELTQQMVAAITAAMADALGSEAWMTPATREVAKHKLAALLPNLAYPAKWRTYAFDVKPDQLYANYERSRTAEVKRGLALAGKAVDRTEWDTTNPYTIDAFYDASRNAAWLPAGILQPPFFGAQRSVAANLGGLGMVIGHELTHAFDDQGARFDADGNLKTWWTADDTKQFTAAGTCVAQQYSTFEAQPKVFVNGNLTLGENIADLGGVTMAFRAYRALRAAAPQHDIADGFSEDQQFFLGVGQAWCGKDRPELARQLLVTDPHSPPKLRVYGALRNLKEFATAFSCAPGTPMNPANSCTVW